MAPKISQSTITEIEERDQANNLIATYIRTPGKRSDDDGRIDIIVNLLDFFLSPV